MQGKGQYVGTYMALTTLERYWYGEGEVKFYLDGDKEYPTICGTGTEDYFGGAWSFARQEVNLRLKRLDVTDIFCPQKYFNSLHRMNAKLTVVFLFFTGNRYMTYLPRLFHSFPLEKYFADLPFLLHTCRFLKNKITLDNCCINILVDKLMLLAFHRTR